MGDRSERRFVRAFVTTSAWQAQRAAASGGATAAPLPDVTFAHEGVAFAGEEKRTGGDYFYVDPSEVDALRTYARAYGQTPVIIGRFDNTRHWLLWNPSEMETTSAGRYRARPDEDRHFATIADPDGGADGIYPSDVPGWKLRLASDGWIGPLHTPADLGSWADSLSINPDDDRSVSDPAGPGEDTPGTEGTDAV